jgi:hypothetical protein
MGARQFVFPPFRLDPVDQQLWREEELVALRPKLFAVLRHLLEHPGRLVTREELLAAACGLWIEIVRSASTMRPPPCEACHSSALQSSPSSRLPFRRGGDDGARRASARRRADTTSGAARPRRVGDPDRPRCRNRNLTSV